MGVPAARGEAVRRVGLVLPPAPMPLVRAGRPLKRWRYVGVYSPELMVCAAEVFVGPLGTRFWGLARPDGELLGRRHLLGSGGVSVAGSRLRVEAGERRSGATPLPRVSVDLALDEAGGPQAVESVSASGRGGYIWTRKSAGVPARGTVALGGRRFSVTAEAVIDDTAGYHPRHTAWCWSAGVGRAVGGERVGWNLVEGVNDDRVDSERTVWVDGIPSEVGPVRFDDDLCRIRSAEGGELRVRPWATLAHRTRLGPLRSDYRQPFGAFRGELPGGVALAEGFGVVERHDAWW